jgi:hypothetical protein
MVYEINMSIKHWWKTTMDGAEVIQENPVPWSLRPQQIPCRQARDRNRASTARERRGSLNYISLLKPTGYVMHQQFNIQQLDALPTLYLCVFYSSENKQRIVPLTALTDWFL